MKSQETGSYSGLLIKFTSRMEYFSKDLIIKI